MTSKFRQPKRRIETRGAASASTNIHSRHEVISYAAKALVPYIKDDSIPDLGGAQAAVYRATRRITSGLLQRTHDQVFAVKEVRLRTSRARERLRNEIRHLTLCDHHNVLKLHEAYIIDQEQWANTVFLVTEPWTQACLQRLIESVAQSTDGKSSLCPWYIPQNLEPWPTIVNQCILGLRHLHEKSIKHKDLKPHNILLLDESNGDYLHPRVRPIIADLGISKEYTIGASSSFQGTLQYLAPEQISRKSSTPESDIFSLGCCFAWIQSILCSSPWKPGNVQDQGICLLEELAVVGFAAKAEAILALLNRLRIDNPTSACPPASTSFFLLMENMITTMFEVSPAKRATIADLLHQLDMHKREFYSGSRASAIPQEDTVSREIFHERGNVRTLTFENISAGEHAQQVIIIPNGQNCSVKKIDAKRYTSQWMGVIPPVAAQNLSTNQRIYETPMEEALPQQHPMVFEVEGDYGGRRV